MLAVRLLRETLTFDITDVIDCAVGKGGHSQAFLSKGKNVTGIDFGPSYLRHSNYNHIQKPLEEVELDPVDLVWSCHTLEHVNNVGVMLTKFREWLKPGGYLALAVPPNQSDRLHIGHVSLWTLAHLMYNLIINGWDCSDAKWYTEDYDIGVLLQKTDDIDFQDRTTMLNEMAWLNKYMPIEVDHKSDSWWPDNWHEETGPRRTV